MHLVAFIVRIYHDARPPERQIQRHFVHSRVEARFAEQPQSSVKGGRKSEVLCTNTGKERSIQELVYIKTCFVFRI